jgi:sterol 14-demethylase
LRRLRDDAGRPRFTTDQITGMFISMMFAGHHTTSGTAAWTLIELLRHPDVLRRVTDELDALFADGRDASYHALREMPVLESAIKEALRLHPPLILLLRRVVHDFHHRGYRVPAGASVGVSPAVSNRMPECFPDPDRFDPARYAPGREEDRRLFAWIPFGAGRHRCVGAAFAMIQLKAVLGALLRDYAFELAQPPQSYRNDHAKMVVQLRQPCRVRYRRRAGAARRAEPARAAEGGAGAGPLRVAVDLDLCQGHAVCVNEAPGLFALDPASLRVRLVREDVPAERRESALAAVRHCPTRALRVVGGEEEV